MAWLKYDDRFTQRSVWDGVSYEARWHYKAMVEECSRGERWDGELPLTRALRSSDVPDPHACLAELEAIGYVTVTRNAAPVDNPASGAVIHRDVTRNGDATLAVTGDAATVTVTRVDEHVPPKSIRNNASDSAVRMRRYRAHKQGKHHLCLPGNCPDAPAENSSTTAPVTDRVTRNTGTGLSQSSAPERSEGRNARDDNEGRESQSGLVGGPGGGVTRNAATGRTAHGAGDRSAADDIEDRKAARALALDWPGVTEELAAWIVGQVRADALARGIPIKFMTHYLARMHENDDLTVYIEAAQARFDRPTGGRPTEPAEPFTDSAPELRLIEDPRAHRKAINACGRCDNNGMTHEDKPRRCDHKPPGHASQPPLLQSVDDVRADDVAADIAEEHGETEAEPTPAAVDRAPDGSFGVEPQPHARSPLTLEEANKILDGLSGPWLEYYLHRAKVNLRSQGGHLDHNQIILAAAAAALRRSA